MSVSTKFDAKDAIHSHSVFQHLLTWEFLKISSRNLSSSDIDGQLVKVHILVPNYLPIFLLFRVRLTKFSYFMRNVRKNTPDTVTSVLARVNDPTSVLIRTLYRIATHSTIISAINNRRAIVNALSAKSANVAYSAGKFFHTLPNQVGRLPGGYTIQNLQSKMGNQLR